MRTGVEGSGRFAVGSLVFDPSSGELTGPEGVERIAPQPASLLALLASRPGQTVTRNEIRAHLWPGGKVEFEQGIAFAVREVRKAIDAAGGDPALLETIPRRGFRLSGTPPHTGAGAGPAVPARRADAVRRALRPLVALGVVATITFGFALTREAVGDAPTVVVFSHATEDAALAALARAVGFELTSALTSALAGQLGVIGPTGTGAVAGPSDTEAARELLGACLVVSGSMRRVGADSVVAFTQVVRALDRVHAWAVQDTASVAVASATVVARVVAGVRTAAGGC